MIQGPDSKDVQRFINNTKQKDWHLSRAITADYTITKADKIKTFFVTGGSTQKTILLPPVADSLDRVIEIQKSDSGIGSVKIDGNAAETIQGKATWTLVQQYDRAVLKCNGSEWFFIVGGHEFKSQILTANITWPIAGVVTTVFTFNPPSNGYYRINAYGTFVNIGPVNDLSCDLIIMKNALQVRKILNSIVAGGLASPRASISGSATLELKTTDILYYKASVQNNNSYLHGAATGPTGWDIQKLSNHFPM